MAHQVDYPLQRIVVLLFLLPVLQVQVLESLFDLCLRHGRFLGRGQDHAGKATAHVGSVAILAGLGRDAVCGTFTSRGFLEGEPDLG